MTSTVSAPKKISLNQDNTVELSVSVLEGFKPSGSFLKVPWPEWADAEINGESWDDYKRVTVVSTETKGVSISGNFFEDPDPPDLPVSIKGEVRSWRRPHEVFKSAKLTVYSTTNKTFELWVPSILARFTFYRYFNEILPLLQFYAVKYGFPVEAESPTFFANTQGEPWRPWHHVYSLCKAGKGQVHKPAYNAYGKYIIRLFYMGCWRQFVVDDKIPCDMNEECMLPCTGQPGELWPILITKAIFKIISLTPTMNFFLNDFPLICVFTGWISLKLTTLNKTDEEVWRRLCALLPRYTYPEEEPSIRSFPTTAKDRTSSRRGSSRKSSTKGTDRKEQRNENFCFLSATLDEFPESQNLVHVCTIALTMVRDFPLMKAQKRERTKMWKRFRWMYWALEKGIWMDERSLAPYRRLHYITIVKEICAFLAPDPKQELTMFEIPNAENETLTEVSSVKSMKDFEVEEWCDFYKFNQHVLDINICLKPSYFRTYYQISSLNNDLVDHRGSGASSPAAKYPSKMPAPTAPQNFYFYLPIPMQFGNEPAYLFCESLSDIFLCFSLSVCPEGIKRFAGYLEAGQPEFLKVGHACLVVETFDWKSLKQGEIIGFVKTVGNSSTGFNLKPGRHVLKLWLYSDSSYVANIYSNVDIGVFEGPKIRFLMGIEAERIKSYIEEVSNAFIALTQKFGKPGLSSALRQFYAAIFPARTSHFNRRIMVDIFIEAFLNSIVVSLKNLVANVEDIKLMVGALRSLFVNLNIECNAQVTSPSLHEGSRKGTSKRFSTVKTRSFSDILTYPWTFEDMSKIIKIQKFFRGFRVRLLLKHQQPTRKEFKSYAERLKKICDYIFVPAKRELEVGKLIRNIVMTNPELLHAFRFYEDLFKVIHVDEFNGKITNVQPQAWVPVARFIIACHCKEPVPCAFYFTCDLEEYVIQAVDNDTNEEMFRLASCVSPYYYTNNVKGYTIFAFGWNKANLKTVNWRIEMVRLKHFQTIHLCNTLLSSSTCSPYNMSNVEIFEVKNYYVPNHKCRICRFLIKVHKPSLLSLRLSTSYSEVSFLLTVHLNKKFCYVDSENTEITDKLMTTAESLNGAVLLPSVFLDCFEPNPWYGESAEEGEATLYILEAIVLNNSWPLTTQEWGVVEPIRVNGENWKESQVFKKERSDSRRLSKTARRSQTETKVESPYWLLQVIHDSSEGPDGNEGFTIEEDKSNLESIKAMKISWEEKDPGRRKRGRELRAKFLSLIASEEKSEVELVKSDDDYRGSRRSSLGKINSFSYLTEDSSPHRLRKSPRILPKMPTQELLKKYKAKSKIRQELEQLVQFSDFEDDFLYCEKLCKFLPVKAACDRKKFLSRARYFRELMEGYFAEEHKLSMLLMEQAYEGRQRAVERLTR